jgi:hypothetical protein
MTQERNTMTDKTIQKIKAILAGVDLTDIDPKDIMAIDSTITASEMLEQRDITNELEIQMFFHCAKCLDELPIGQSPRDFVRIEAGFTPLGIQIWCVRHEINICHVDFQGQQHPANLTAKL